jgi:hypothetical protein
VVQFVPLCLKVRLDISQALTARKLGQGHPEELIPATGAPQLLSLMVLSGQRLEFMSRQRLEQLMNSSVMMRQSLNLPDYNVFSTKTLYPVWFRLFQLSQTVGQQCLFRGLFYALLVSVALGNRGIKSRCFA